MDALFSRRSIRKYTNEPVSDDEIKKLLEAGMSAPSAGNEQPWHFIVIRDKNVMEAIMKVHPYSQMLKEASAAIIVCGDIDAQKYKGFWIEDCSAATENILIEAVELGLGAVWCGIYPHEDRTEGIKKVLNLPTNIIPLSLIPIGYPAETKDPANRFDQSRIHNDRW